uniref:Pentatricopeptide repeat-containing protein n=1 Tax=Ditylenchus dipsaci TaxID=166011 RepID=A0A915E1R3_9BILA
MHQEAVSIYRQMSLLGMDPESCNNYMRMERTLEEGDSDVQFILSQVKRARFKKSDWKTIDFLQVVAEEIQLIPWILP